MECFYHGEKKNKTETEKKQICIYRVIDAAASQLTKTAITVTAIFIVALGYDLWHYLLGHLGVTEYIYNSPKQKYGKLNASILDRRIEIVR